MATGSRKYATTQGLKGFTLFELLIVVVILGIAATMMGPAMSRIVRHQRVNRASMIIVSDLQNAFAVAARQREPVRVQADAASRSYQFVDRKTGAVLRIRAFYGDTSEYKLSTLLFTPATFDVFPNGVSSAPVTIDLANGDYARRITASTAGFVRLVPQ
ncbi:MAG TPA: prepilin-type N-terminal cleavage/methylation domain-containing protein [Gemmatimonadaceae bacterium]|jgi:prepilin-type N-terminal cleavage/methylation domain-containing protein|nr:prepilin-type N-terminal cleavage/methylation domain-containing protein [Gemmatimonadaceae bacterium]